MKHAIFLFLLFVCISIVTIQVFASNHDTDVFVVIEPGDLILTNPNKINDFPAVTEVKQPIKLTTSFGGAFKINDSRSLNEEWRLTVSASQFTDVSASATSKNKKPLTLPNGSLSLSYPMKITHLHDDDSVTVSNKNTPWIIDNNNPVTVLKSNKNNSHIEVEMLFPKDALTLSLDPATTKKNAEAAKGKPTIYHSTITWSLVVGP